MHVKQMMKPKIKSFTPFKSTSTLSNNNNNNTNTITHNNNNNNNNVAITNQYISSISVEEKAVYDITMDVAFNVKNTLVDYYKTAFPFQVYIRQNKYLIPFKQSTSTVILQSIYKSNTNIHKDIYIQIHNIDNDVIYVSKQNLESVLYAINNNKGISRQRITDIKGDNHIVNVFYELAIIYKRNTFTNDECSNNCIINVKKSIHNNNNPLLKTRHYTPIKPHSNRNFVNITFNNNSHLNNSILSNASPVNSVSSTISNNISLLKLRQCYPVLDYTSTALDDNVNVNDIVELYNTRNRPFKVRKCFIKHLITKILHNLPLPSTERVIDINNTTQVISLEDFTIYLKLIQQSNIGEILFAEDNRYFTANDIENKQHFVKSKYMLNTNNHNDSVNSLNSANPDDLVKLTTLSSNDDRSFCYSKGTTCFKVKNLVPTNDIDGVNVDTEISYIKLYDVNNNTIIISQEQVIHVYCKLLNKERISSKKVIYTEKGEEMVINVNKMRYKAQTYYADGNKYIDNNIPYVINNEENISFFEVTNCENGSKLFMKTIKLFSLIKNNIGRDFIYIDADKKIRLCVEELKDILKIDNQHNEYIRIVNISNKDCFIKKSMVYAYIHKLIANTNVNDIITMNDYDNKSYYFDMKTLCKHLFSIQYCPYLKDDILKLNQNTFILSTQGFIKVNINPSNDLFEFIQIEDDKANTFYVRKPFIRGLIYTCANNQMSLPECVDVVDFNRKKHRVNLKMFVKNYIRYKTKFGNVKVVFNLSNVFVEVEYKERKVLVRKHEVENFVFEKKNANAFGTTRRMVRKVMLKDGNDKLVEIDYKAAKACNTKYEWYSAEDKNGEKVFLYKKTIKEFILNKLFEPKKGIGVSKGYYWMEVFDYYGRKRLVDCEKVVNGFVFEKTFIKETKRVVVEVFDK